MCFSFVSSPSCFHVSPALQICSQNPPRAQGTLRYHCGVSAWLRAQPRTILHADCPFENSPFYADTPILLKQSALASVRLPRRVLRAPMCNAACSGTALGPLIFAPYVSSSLNSFLMCVVNPVFRYVHITHLWIWVAFRLIQTVDVHRCDFSVKKMMLFIAVLQ